MTYDVVLNIDIVCWYTISYVWPTISYVFFHCDALLFQSPWDPLQCCGHIGWTFWAVCASSRPHIGRAKVGNTVFLQFRSWKNWPMKCAGPLNGYLIASLYGSGCNRSFFLAMPGAGGGGFSTCRASDPMQMVVWPRRGTVGVQISSNGQSGCTRGGLCATLPLKWYMLMVTVWVGGGAAHARTSPAVA